MKHLHALLYYFCLGVFGVGAFAVNAIAFFLCLLRLQNYSHRFTLHLIGALMSFFKWLCEVLRLGHIDLEAMKQRHRVRETNERDASPNKGIIYVANHTGLLDALFLMACFPNAIYIAKKQLLKNPFFSHTPRAAGFIINDLKAEVLYQVIRRVERGEDFIIFPEGTRTTTPPVNAFYRGFALIALRAGAPVQTILIQNPAGLCSKHLSLFKVPELPLHYSFHYGECFESNVEDSKESLTQRVESYYRAVLSQREAPDLQSQHL